MALKAVHVSEVPHLDEVPKGPSVALVASRHHKGVELGRSTFAPARFTVVGHRGKGMNALASLDPRMKAVKENSILSFNEAGRYPIDFVEFDVQILPDHTYYPALGKMSRTNYPEELCRFLMGSSIREN